MGAQKTGRTRVYYKMAASHTKTAISPEHNKAESVHITWNSSPKVCQEDKSWDRPFPRMQN